MADTKISETLEFLTQIHTAWVNTEQRMALRKYPRRYVSYEYIGMKPSQSQYLRALLYSKQTEQIEIPLWHAGCELPEQTFIGQSEIRLQTDKIWPYRGCRKAIFWYDDQRGGDPYILQSLLGDGTLKLGEQMGKIYPARRTTVFPVAYAILQQEDKYNLYTSAHMSMQLNLELMTNEVMVPIPASLDEYHDVPWQTKSPWQTALPTLYMGTEVFPIAPAWNGNIAANFTRNANKLDNQTGMIRYDLKSMDTSETKEIEYIGLSRSEVHNLQRFFCRCKGQCKSFYAPTWLSDMVLAADAPAGQNYLLVEFPLFWKYYGSLARRKTIVVFLNNYTTKILSIGGFTTNDTGEMGKVLLDSPLQTAIRKNSVAMISFLCRYRHDSDTMITNYETVGIASTAFTFAEVNA